MLNVRLSGDLEERLKTITQKTHRTKTYYVEEALKSYLDANEEILLAIADYEEQHRKGTLITYSLEEVMAKLKLHPNDLED